MTLEEFKATVEEGDIYSVMHRPMISLRIIRVVRDGLFEDEDVTHVVFAFTLNNRDAKVVNVEYFYSLIESGMLLLVTPHKYKQGDAFYGINGNIYVVQCKSNIHHPHTGPRYMVTVVETIGQEDCPPDKWGRRLGKRYILEEAILEEKTLDQLEPFETFTVVEDLNLDNMLDEYEALLPAEGVNDCENPKKGYVR